ncbi:MAG: hypothetical protein WAM14_04545 [Candidatus Nitrosopolaris sp.]
MLVFYVLLYPFFLDIFGIKPNDPAATLDNTQFGNFTANFKAVPPPTPPEYLVTLFGIMVGTFAPSLFHWLNGLREKKFA